ncbi:uncharacterized protein LOC132719663 isoform X1 [Ruditapes philippinarum]|uniref:uncharacterized protein LOC132719663 isoform X1 n=1 Tax=Ruditapes philippinarum TaxID=129788 RepID=UPI00295AC436|nr:uncharacterized protein LOC132719663 isoform X1 [Ruditapes philippinarum]
MCRQEDKQQNHSQSKFQTQSNEEQPGATHLIFSGFTKDQVMAELKPYASKEKGTAKLFRMLFNIEEIKGLSLFGMRKGNRESDARPSCADKAKLKFLEDCALEKLPTT